jgi:hypothetical protein
MPLTNAAVKNAPPQAKPYKLSDGNGLYLLVQPNGRKLWRMNYRYLNKQKTIAFGTRETGATGQRSSLRQEAILRTRSARSVLARSAHREIPSNRSRRNGSRSRSAKG